MEEEQKSMGTLEAIMAAGVVGAGGAGFPTHIKLKAKADTFIVNAVECEPLIGADKFCCREDSDRIVKGTLAAAKLIGAKHLIIALKRTYTAEIEALQKAVDQAKAPIEIFQTEPFYPAGDEQTLVYCVTQRSIPEGGLPLDVGAVVDNVGTVLNIARAMEGKAVTHKRLSVIGEVEKPLMLEVPIGTNILDCIRPAKPKDQEYAVILGGPMMGRIITDPKAMAKEVVTKTLENLFVLPKDHALIRHHEIPIERVQKKAMAACIQCRMCTDLCPRFLIGHRMEPHRIMRNAFKEKMLEDDAMYLKAFGEAANCCDCGVCEMFSCPMGLSPKRMNQYFKGKLREKHLALEKNKDPKAKATIDERRVPTQRLIGRLGLSVYSGQHLSALMTIEPANVRIPLRMHIGAPAQKIVSVGDKLHCGDLIAKMGGKVSANIHSSIDGTVTAADKDWIEIERGAIQ